MGGRALKRSSTFSAVNKSSHLDISITIGLETENSSAVGAGGVDFGSVIFW